jgi:restriction endonuclease S subunit
MSFPAYVHYRELQQSWLGPFPDHWKAAPLWTLFRRTKRTGLEGEQLLSVYRDYGVIPKSSRDDNFNKPSDDLGLYQLVEPGDLVINKMKAWQGSVAISEHRGIVSPAYFVFQSKHHENGRFLHYLLRSAEYTGAYLSISKGIRPNQWDLEPQEHSRLPVILPPLTEQQAIVTFLDRETAKIDALVEEQRRLIDLLKEKRQAVISHAVTEGLKPEAPMKDSGVEWLGQVPAHWEVRPLKYLTAFESGCTPNKANAEFWDGDIPWASAKDLKTDVLTDTQDHVSSKALEAGAASLVPQGTVVVLVRGMMLAKTFPVVLLNAPMAINQDLKALVRPRLASGYLAWTLRGLEAETLARLDESGHGTKALRMDAWSSIELPEPPIEEQIAIAQFLDEATIAIDGLMSEVERSIALLQERRSALISAAVTGEIDARAIISARTKRSDEVDVRLAVAADLIERFSHQPTFGRVKLQKLVYLAEVHGGIDEIGGGYLREAAGPLDRGLIDDIEVGLQRAGHIAVSQPEGPGSLVSYRVCGTRGAYRQQLKAGIGARINQFDHLATALADIDTRGTEAVATLYAVWNDGILDGQTPSDQDIVSGVLNDWHPEKKKKFRADELHTWLGWMRRHDLVPTGRGPRTRTGRLFI